MVSCSPEYKIICKEAIVSLSVVNAYHRKRESCVQTRALHMKCTSVVSSRIKISIFAVRLIKHDYLSKAFMGGLAEFDREMPPDKF